ncbi:hypothetical protein [Dactylosporangium matsuzakiense]|uniref:hypothetical protein n=1 Tax=Dactylosporangium matsuzakiense TaxID=53360 RepID=UPI0021C25ABF|nr:hypothetical protein [Dactylosporangium matsuzakiense]UWZ41136.1 hypothetical protein Dmats_25875 [Dactylosporangium matsuzakiense]
MGTSYQNVLVLGELADVVRALTDLGGDAWLLPAGPGRVAVLPRENAYGYADADAHARLLSAKLGTLAASNSVVDSDVVFIELYRNGEHFHSYVSEQEFLVDWFIDGAGAPRYRLGGVEYPADAPYPKGPGGADPAVFAPFGVGPVDLDRLGVALRGEGGDAFLAEDLDHSIMEALHLDPAGLRTAFRWAAEEDLPGLVRVAPRADRA